MNAPETSPREAFIPFSRRDLLKMILRDEVFASEPEQSGCFRNFAELIGAWLHHSYHSRLEALKAACAHLDPDRDTLARGGRPMPTSARGARASS